MAARIVIRSRGRDVSREDTEAITAAFLAALSMAERVASEMDAIWNQPGLVRRRRERRRDAWSSHVNFTTWFGASRDLPLLRRLRRRIEKLRTWLDTGRIVVYVHNTGDLGCRANRNAFSRIPRRPLKVHLCPPWFANTTPRRGAIVIHELVHELGFAHPGGTTTRSAALALAARSSRLARRSPENFEGLYQLYG